jgi:antitoxin FitA
MASITVRDIPDPLYRRLQLTAEENHRSLNKEIIARLEQSFRKRDISVEDELREVRALRASIGTRWSSDEEITRAKREGRK